MKEFSVGGSPENTTFGMHAFKIIRDFNNEFKDEGYCHTSTHMHMDLD